MDNKQNYLKDFREALENLSIADLRSRATKNFGLKLTREHTKQDIIDLIVSVASKQNFADAAEGSIRPGYVRLKLQPIPGKAPAGFPVFLNCNGYSVFVPVDAVVDLPIKMIETLEHAEEIHQVRNEFGGYSDSMSLSYPYQIIGRCEGPDPRPGLEVARERKLAPKREFFKKYGYWPSDKVLMAAQASSVRFNMFDITPDETAENE